MKTLSINLILLLIISFSYFSCKEDGPRKKTVDFKADFFTVLESFEPSTECPADNLLNTQVGSGTGTYIGGFTTRITFCANPTTLAYFNGKGSFVAENGDEIFIAGEGQILPSDKPGYDLEFFDEFEVVGGTGRFTGAKGKLTTESYVNLTTQQTDHIWKGKVTFIK